MPTNPSINYVEKTGPVTRVGVLNDNERRAIAIAEEEMGGAECSFADMTAWGFEVVFENAYLP